MNLVITTKSIVTLSFIGALSLSGLTACDKQESQTNKETSTQSNESLTVNKVESQQSEAQESMESNPDTSNKTINADNLNKISEESTDDDAGDDLASQLEREAMAAADAVE